MAVPVTTTIQNQIANLYIAILGRNPEPAGFGYWCDTLANNGGTQAALNAITIGFGKSPEFIGTYGGQTTSAAITLMYNNVLNRAPDANGLSYWTAQYNSYIAQGNTVSAALALTGNAIITAAAANTGTADQTLILSKEATAIAAGTSAPTTTYTLTTNPETISGSNITINGYVDGAADTLIAADVLTGTGGTNTLNITVADGTATTNGALISGIQTVNVRNAGGGAAAINATNTAGATLITSNLSTGTLAVTNLASGAAFGINGNGSLTNGAVDVAYKTASAAITLNLANGVSQTAAVGAIDFSASTAATAVINSTGASNAVGGIDLGGGTASLTSLTINAATSLTVSDGGAGAEILGWLAGGTANTLTISGAASTVTTGNLSAVNVGLLGAEVDVVNASGLTAGGVELTLSAVTQAITGGAGNDSITTNSIVLTTGSVNAGTGTGDRLIVSAAADIATTPAAKYTNFEILRNATNDNLNVSTVAGITSLELIGGGGATNMTAAQSVAITNLANTDTATLALTTSTGTSDVLTVTLANIGTATTSADLTTLTANGFETMNVVSSAGKSSDISALSFAAADSLTALNISGAKPISVSTTNITTLGGTAINASGITYTSSTSTDYALTISGNLVKGSSVVGTSAIDSITTTARIAGTSGNYVTYDAGTGNDAIRTTIAAINNTNAGFGSLQINGGGGTDTLTTTDLGGTMVDANFQYLTNIEKITIGDDGADVSITTGGFFNTNFATSVTLTSILGDAGEAITMNLGTYTGNATLVVTTGLVGDAGNLELTTGTGTDTLTVTASSYIGDAAGGGDIVIATGAGVDTISLTTGTLVDDNLSVVTIEAGLAADIITMAGLNGDTTGDFVAPTLIINAGDSTTTAYDQVTGFDIATAARASSCLDFDNAGVTVYAAQAATGYSAAQLTVAVDADGLATFAGTSAATLTLAQQISALASVVTVNDGDSAFFVNNGNTYVFNNDTAGDSVVMLVAQTGVLSLDTTNASTVGLLFIS